MRTINPTIATTMTMTTTFGSLKLARDHECGCNVALASTERHDPFCVGAGSAKQPTSPETQDDKQKPRKDCSGAEHLYHFVDVRRSDQAYQQDEADVGNPVEHGLHACGQLPVARLEGEAYGKREAALTAEENGQSPTN